MSGSLLHRMTSPVGQEMPCAVSGVAIAIARHSCIIRKRWTNNMREYHSKYQLVRGSVCDEVGVEMTRMPTAFSRTFAGMSWHDWAHQGGCTYTLTMWYICRRRLERFSFMDCEISQCDSNQMALGTSTAPRLVDGWRRPGRTPHSI